MKKVLFGFAFAVALPLFAQQKPVYLDASKPMEVRVEDALKRLTVEEKVAMLHAQSKFSSPGVPRLGIPEFWMTDGPHGIRPEVLWDEWNQAGWTNDSCVAFPALTCLAATWNPEMSMLYGKSIGEEARYRNKTVLLGPGVNIYRTPLNGRNFEYMGEDPYLASRMVVPYVQGVQQNGVAACVKHYALNNQEINRHTTNVIVDDRALYEIYLPAFKAAVQEGKAWSIMGAYNLYKGQHACHNQYLLNDILRGEWGFDGVVVSDWGGTHDTDQAITNGLDMEFGSWTDGLANGSSNAYDNYYLAMPYLERIKSGKVGTKELDEKVRRILRLAFRTTMDVNRPFGSILSPEHYEAARRIGEEGIVLLQNKDGVLPIDLNKVKKIAVIGAGLLGELGVYLFGRGEDQLLHEGAVAAEGVSFDAERCRKAAKRDVNPHAVLFPFEYERRYGVTRSVADQPEVEALQFRAEIQPVLFALHGLGLQSEVSGNISRSFGFALREEELPADVCRAVLLDQPFDDDRIIFVPQVRFVFSRMCIPIECFSLFGS